MRKYALAYVKDGQTLYVCAWKERGEPVGINLPEQALQHSWALARIQARGLKRKYGWTVVLVPDDGSEIVTDWEKPRKLDVPAVKEHDATQFETYGPKGAVKSREQAEWVLQHMGRTYEVMAARECIYCGAETTSKNIDHIPSVVRAARGAEGPFIGVPCCALCNSTLKDIDLNCLAERSAYLLGRYIKRQKSQDKVQAVLLRKRAAEQLCAKRCRCRTMVLGQRRLESRADAAANRKGMPQYFQKWAAFFPRALEPEDRRKPLVLQDRDYSELAKMVERRTRET